MPSSVQPSRRELLQLTAATGLLGLTPAVLKAQDAPARPARGGAPKNIIFMVADGMSMGALSMSEPFSQLVRSRSLHWGGLLQRPDVVRGYFDTSSLSSLVTDSSAASSAWATGTRVFNAAVNMLPDGTKLRPIGSLAVEHGRRVGLVTTTRITHATPAGFASVEARRDNEDGIAPQYKGTVDVLLGGGLEHFDAKRRKDKRDLLADYAAAGYTLWNTRAQVTGTERPSKVLGLFWDGHLPMSIDHQNDEELQKRVPTLAEMTRTALDILSAAGDGFLLQVEGGRVDHAAHSNDAPAQLWDMLAFDEAIAVALQFAEARGDTLVVITTDHGNANPGLNGTGGEYRESTKAFGRVVPAKTSFELLLPKLGKTASADDAGDLIKEAYGLKLKKEEAQAVYDLAHDHLPAEINRQHRNQVGLLGEILGNYFGIGWTGVSHTQDWVIVSSFGPGAEQFGGLLLNTDAYKRITGFWQIDYVNPHMTLDEAKAFAVAPRAMPDWA